MGNANISVSAAYLRGLTEYLAECGQDPARMMARFELSPAILEDPNQRVPVPVYEAMLAHGETLLGDPDIGLHVGERIRPGQYGALGYAVMNSATLEDAVYRHMRYENLVSTVAETRYLTHQDPVHLVWDLGSRQVSRHFAEEMVASWVSFTRWMVGQPLAPSAIDFRHEEPADTSTHERIFQCPLTFGAEQVEVRFPQAYLATRIPHHDPYMMSMMDAYAEKLLVELVEEDDPVAEARAFIAGRIQGGELSLAEVAEHLQCSQRQLQRRLRDAGLTYQQLLDDTRRTLALHYVMDPALSFMDTAFLLGFSDPSAFQRAFKRWTNLTPGQYREQHRE